MPNRVYGITFPVVLALAVLAQAQTFTTLYNFAGQSDGGNPIAGVVQDAAGTLYGTALNFGSCCGNGVVYEVNTAGTETVLHAFCSHGNCGDGIDPETPVARDAAGNLYGTTYYGGSSDYGTVFKLDTAGNETVLYSFTGGSDGCLPYQGLVVAKSATVFGTTSGCGSSGYGTIFKVDSAGNFTLLHGFTGTSSDGANPTFGHLAMDKSGNLYGLTVYGGSTTRCYPNSCGVLYELSNKGTFTVLHRFKGGTKDGCNPYGSVLQDKAGNLYGTTDWCGSTGNGTIWKVSKKGKETVLHNFAGGSSDGCEPPGGVTRDSKGNLYGVTYYCGANREGALYELSAHGTLTLLHSFENSDGAYPLGEVLRTPKGTLYGTTFIDGTYSYGTVWKYVP